MVLFNLLNYFQKDLLVVKDNIQKLLSNILLLYHLISRNVMLTTFLYVKEVFATRIFKYAKRLEHAVDLVKGTICHKSKQKSIITCEFFYSNVLKVIIIYNTTIQRNK